MALEKEILDSHVRYSGWNEVARGFQEKHGPYDSNLRNKVSSLLQHHVDLAGTPPDLVDNYIRTGYTLTTKEFLEKARKGKKTIISEAAKKIKVDDLEDIISLDPELIEIQQIAQLAQRDPSIVIPYIIKEFEDNPYKNAVFYHLRADPNYGAILFRSLVANKIESKKQELMYRDNVDRSKVEAKLKEHLDKLKDKDGEVELYSRLVDYATK